MSAAKTSAFENVKDQIGYCGIWCGSCAVGNGALAEVAKECARLIQGYGLKSWGPRDVDYDQLSKALESTQTIGSCSGCLNGGGRESCEMRDCAVGKDIRECAQCPKEDDCPHSQPREMMRRGARNAGLFVKSGREDPGKFVARSTEALKGTNPASILFV
jgi:hypothetical protein